MKFIVLEMQTNSDGTVGTLLTAYDNKSEAESKFYTVCAAAALSSLPVHTAVLMSNNGVMLKCEAFVRETEA